MYQLGNPDGYDSFATYLVIGKDKKRIRVMRLDQLAALREANKTPLQVSDVDFLMGDPQFKSFMKGVGASHIEFGLCRMSPKNMSKRRVDFPASAFDGSSTETKASKIHQ